MSEYTYRGIPAYHGFRVIKLHGSSDPSSILECDLIEGSLDSGYPPYYEAISYCWNGQRLTQSVLCEGKRLPVTANCEAALRRFRPAVDGEIRLLWIDSICIDQNSTQERSSQVAVMGTIFNKANKVLVWLGSETDTAYDRHAATFQWLMRLGRAAKNGTDEAKQAALLQLAHELNSADLNEFVNGVPWFKRLWVIQEVALSRAAQLVYGHLEASLQDILEARDLLGRMDRGDGADKPGAGAASMALWNAFAVHDLGTRLLSSSHGENKPNEVAVCNFMAEARFSGATDERDKIFALYNILTESGVDLAAPDYAKPTAEVYHEAAVAMIKSTKSLRILELVDGLGSTEDLASWAPDWSSTKHSLGLGLGLGKEKLPDNPYSNAVFAFQDNDRHLVLQGMIVDEVVSRSSESYMHVDERIGNPGDYNRWTKNPQPSDQHYSGLLESVPELSSDILRVWNVRVMVDFISVALGCHPVDASEESIVALYRTLMSQIHPNVAEKDSGRAREWFQVLYDGLMSLKEPQQNAESYASTNRRDSACSVSPPSTWPRNRRYLPQIDPDHPIASQLMTTPEYETLKRIYDNPILDTFHSRIDRIRYKTIFTTSSGKIGIAPWSIRSGDKIAFISGLRIPMVIRPQGRYYKLVTQAHVEGLMHGEGWVGDASQLSELVLV